MIMPTDIYESGDEMNVLLTKGSWNTNDDAFSSGASSFAGFTSLGADISHNTFSSDIFSPTLTKAAS